MITASSEKGGLLVKGLPMFSKPSNADFGCCNNKLSVSELLQSHYVAAKKWRRQRRPKVSRGRFWELGGTWAGL